MFKLTIKLIFIFFITNIFNQSFSKETKFEKRLKKDIDKLSKISGFIDNELKLYDEELVIDKKILSSLFIIMVHVLQKRDEKNALKELEGFLKLFLVYIIKK